MKGELILIGGAEDKIYDKVVLKRIVSINNARSVAIIPTASYGYPEELGEEYTDIFRTLGVTMTHVLDIRSQTEAEDPRYIEMLEGVDLIFFTGGDQVRLVEILRKSPVLQEIRKQHLSGCSIAGTSAGAAASGDPMIYDGDKYGFQKGSVNFSEGFGFIKGITIDTHFVKRGRISRLTQFLVSGHNQYALGLAEDTALMINANYQAEVVGSGVVTALSSRYVTYSNYNQIEEDAHITVDGMRLSFLATGSVFDLKSWSHVTTRPKIRRSISDQNQDYLQAKTA